MIPTYKCDNNTISRGNYIKIEFNSEKTRNNDFSSEMCLSRSSQHTLKVHISQTLNFSQGKGAWKVSKILIFPIFLKKICFEGKIIKTQIFFPIKFSLI